MELNRERYSCNAHSKTEVCLGNRVHVTDNDLNFCFLKAVPESSKLLGFADNFQIILGVA